MKALLFNEFVSLYTVKTARLYGKGTKNRASKLPYISSNQLTLVGFESPFSQHLDPNNRWVVLAHKIPWDILVSTYERSMQTSDMGADGINPRVAIGALILKHICNTSDRETVLQIQEKMNVFAFLDDLSWEAFNEGTRLMSTVEKYKRRFGKYPEEVLADKIYCNRANEIQSKASLDKQRQLTD